MLIGSGVLVYNPARKGLKSNNEWWAVVNTDDEICRYFRYLLWARKKIKLNKPAWGAHISVVRGTKPTNFQYWNKYKNEAISFTYENKIRQAGDTTGWDRNDNFWFVDIYSDRLAEIRVELGLDKTPKTKYHLTIGREYRKEKK